MDIYRFAARFPTLHHATFAENLPLILRHGLLCAREVVRRAGFNPEDAERLLSEPRLQPVEMIWPGGEAAVLRDQRPLNLNHLTRKFPQISAENYTLNLSERVFFWCESNKKTAAGSDIYYGRKQIVLHFDTASLLRDHAARIELCRINSGAVLMPAAVGAEENRNPATMFSPFARCDWRLSQIKEVTLVGSLDDPLSYLKRAPS